MAKLYHYSPKRFDSLMTRRQSGLATPDDIKKGVEEAKRFNWPGNYVDHISFFFEPLPSKQIGKLFNNDHPVWFDGNRLFEYVVDTDVLDKRILFDVVESEKKTRFADEFAKKHNWVEDNPDLLSRYLAEAKVKRQLWGEVGVSLDGLVKQIEANQDKLLSCYKAAVKREDFEFNRTKYAANVPHVMIYPSSGIVPYEQVNSLIIGSDRREVILITKPKALNW